jgi:hypothetical protein
VYDPRVRELPSHARIRHAGRLIGALCTVIVITPVLIAGAAYFLRARSFPVLVEFSSPLSTYFIGAYDAVVVERERLPDRDAVGLHARLLGGRGWALVLWETYPDWSGYRHLALELINTSPLPLVVRIRIRDPDHRNDRKAGYVGSIEVKPRTRKIHRIRLQVATSASDAAVLDLAHTRAIVLSSHATNGAPDFYLTRIWLE